MSVFHCIFKFSGDQVLIPAVAKSFCDLNVRL